MKVLILDDAPAVRSRLAAMFSELPGVDAVFEASSLTEASVALVTHSPGVVVVDLRLRGESGLAFLPRVRHDRPDALLIVLTNDPSARHRRECLALGVKHFFDKSRHFDDVCHLVAAVAAPQRPLARPEP